MKILLLDNYDSFTYNLAHLIEMVSGERPAVKKNDAINCAEVAEYDAIVLSPGPGLPAEAGIMPDILRAYHKTKPILGVCLGLQAIAEQFGGRLKNLQKVFHGQASAIHVTEEKPLFCDLPSTFSAGRYHSWVIDETFLPENMQVTARDENGNIMAASHTQLNIHGVQFHPESILSDFGDIIIRNWLTVAK